MTVAELIDALQHVEQDKQVYAWQDGSLFAVKELDELSDRVDFNIEGV
jgi:uncharacterized protein YerC